MVAPMPPTSAAGEAAFVSRKVRRASVGSRTSLPTPHEAFCAKCGTPLTYEHARSPKWVNIPRAIFETRTGREPRYHLLISEAPEWAYRGEPLVQLKWHPGVMWERPGRKKKQRMGESD